MWSVFAQRNLVGTGAAGREIPASIVQAVVSPEMPDFQCWRCAARPGARLWNRDNWQDDPLNVQHSSADWLKGSLKNNVHERPRFLRSLGLDVPNIEMSRFYSGRHKKKRPVRHYVPTSIPDSNIKLILSELCAMDTCPQNAQDGDNLPDVFDGITDDTLLCEACLGQMVTSRLWRWWARKKKAFPEEAIKANCKEGYDCPKQDCDSVHASLYNHACVSVKEKEEAEVEAILSDHGVPFVVNSNHGS
ncbi:hypothetical protein EXIGLDRAFT_364488 [Exidia glandulosa HHB12029]|uniref:Uncharacterized protein n=1 Tax=Exidia glandulosa HHB12029 TaxID=1314781 RepID=A0A165C485_EXIGL|nr:hypothetical protein EXIGLDRAFT_364488 [Exidia glandulosa HHB12029]